MRRRLLLLCVGIASLGAIFVSVVLANPTSNSSTTGSGSVSVTGLTGLSVAFANQVTNIPANGAAQKVADIMAGENDDNYNIRADDVSITGQGVTGGTCTGIAALRYTLANDATPTGDLNPDSAAANTDIADLNLTLPVTVANDCTVSGAIVQVVFVAQ